VINLVDEDLAATDQLLYKQTVCCRLLEWNANFKGEFLQQWSFNFPIYVSARIHSCGLKLASFVHFSVHYAAVNIYFIFPIT